MAIDLTLEEPIEAGNGYSPMLHNLQGNILKSHGRAHVRLLLIRFGPDVTNNRNAISSFASTRLTSAWEQLQQVERHRSGGDDSSIFASFYLTFTGYQALGFDSADLKQRFGASQPFVGGMANWTWSTQDDLGKYETAYKSPIDAMVLLAAKKAQDVEQASSEVEQNFAGATIFREEGSILRNDNDETVEPFGYVDGRSQPLFLKDDLEREESCGGTHPWNPLAPLSLVLEKDPYVGQEDCLGSYLVFRKLEQDVERFKASIQQLAAAFTGGNEEWARAMVVGRFANGTPILSHRVPSDCSMRTFNNFDYASDRQGTRCPLHSHIRKANPRSEREKRIVRRGTPYQTTEGKQGLLFLCFQSNLVDQFLAIQSSWLNRSGNLTGMDPVAGQKEIGSAPQTWSREWGKAPEKNDNFDFSGFVTCRGGEFFFAPSIPFLLNPTPPPPPVANP
ncbi:MAG: Dyp-type peroxidase [Acidobacteria bacterium]|nr:Dyp-type peroxidase [Acidobacteriota bacterium]